ncbi:MAG: hypothetical protein HW407_1053 [Bacteroidetes bacterium]|nr:hypothetical protein [Bacteroidota bacterium]
MKILEIGNYRIRPVVVVVQELPHRTEFILKELASKGIEPDVFNGFDSQQCGLRTEHTYEFDSPGSGYRIGAKEIANWVSFYSLWSALNMQADEHFLQLEWDADFHPGWFQRAEKALRDTPEDFDMLQLGSCCCMDKPRTQVAGDVWQVKWPACGHATILARKCIPALLRSQRKVWAPMDLSLIFGTFEQEGIKLFTVLPRMADQFNTNLAA